MGDVSVQALVEAVRERAPGDDPLALLETAIAVAEETSGAVEELLEQYVGAARAANVSWTLIGDRFGVSKQGARQKFARRLEAGGGTGGAGAAMPMSPRLSACLQAAQAAADADGSVSGTQHLLLGLLHAGTAASVLDRLGVTRDKVREASARLFEPAVIAGDDGQERHVAGDGEGEQAVTAARNLAASRGQAQFRTGHLLFCVALDPGSAARRVLNDLGVDPARVKQELEGSVAAVQRRRRRAGRAEGTG